MAKKKSGSGDRDVLFRVGVDRHPATAQALKELRDGTESIRIATANLVVDWANVQDSAEAMSRASVSQFANMRNEVASLRHEVGQLFQDMSNLSAGNARLTVSAGAGIVTPVEAAMPQPVQLTTELRQAIPSLAPPSTPLVPPTTPPPETSIAPVAPPSDTRKPSVSLKQVDKDMYSIREGDQEIGYLTYSQDGTSAKIENTAIYNDHRGRKLMPEIYPQFEREMAKRGVQRIDADVVDAPVGHKVWGPLGFEKIGEYGDIEQYQKQVGEHKFTGAEKRQAEQEKQRRGLLEEMGLSGLDQAEELSLKDVQKVLKNRQRFAAKINSETAAELAKQREESPRRQELLGDLGLVGDQESEQKSLKELEGMLKRRTETTEKLLKEERAKASELAEKNSLLDALKLKGDPRADALDNDELEKILKNRQRFAAKVNAETASELAKQRSEAPRRQELVDELEIAGTPDSQRPLKELEQLHKERQRTVVEGLKAERRSHEEHEAALTHAHSRLRSGNERLADSFSATTEGIARMGRGIAALGLVGEEETKQLLDGLLKIQAAFDIAVGSVNTLKNGLRGLEAFSDAKAAARTIGDLTTLSASRTVGNAADGVDLVEDVASNRIVRGQAAQTVADVGSSAARGGAMAAQGTAAAGTAGGGALVGGATVTIGAAAAAIGALAAAATSTVDGLMQMSQHGLRAGATVGSWTDKVASSEVSVLAWADKVTKSVGGLDMLANFSPVGWAAKGLGITGAVAGYTESQQRVDRSEKQLAQDRDRRQLREEQAEVTGRAENRIAAIEADARDQQRQWEALTTPADNSDRERADVLSQRIRDLGDPTDDQSSHLAESIRQSEILRLRKERRSTLEDAAGTNLRPELDRVREASSVESRALDDARLTLGGLGADAPEAARREAMEKVAMLQNRVTELAKEQLGIERAIGEQKQDAVKSSIDGIREEISLRRQEAKHASSSLQSARERFGELDPEEQRRLIMFRQRADSAAETSLALPERLEYTRIAHQRDASGAESLNERDRTRLDELDNKRRDAAARALGREGREALAGMGTAYEADLVRRASRQSAESAGFDRYFGQEERRQAVDAKAAAQRLEVELRDKRELKVDVALDVEEVVRRVRNDAMAAIHQKTEHLLEKVRNDLQAQMTEINRSHSQVMANRAIAR